MKKTFFCPIWSFIYLFAFKICFIEKCFSISFWNCNCCSVALLNWTKFSDPISSFVHLCFISFSRIDSSKNSCQWQWCRERHTRSTWFIVLKQVVIVLLFEAIVFRCIPQRSFVRVTAHNWENKNSTATICLSLHRDNCVQYRELWLLSACNGSLLYVD